MTEWNISMVLLAKHKSDVKVNTDGWLISEKLDGIRGLWNGKEIRSRQNKPIATPDYFTENFPPFPLDGELWLGRGLFQQAMSIVRQKFPDDRWKQIKYLVFDSMDCMEDPFSKRLELAQQWFTDHPSEYVEVIDQVPCKDDAEIAQRLEKIVAEKGEGLMIRDPNASYEGKRSKSILKIKPVYDAEAIIMGYTDGKGKYTGMVGAFKVMDEEGHEFNLSGMVDALRADPPKIGSIVSFQFNDKTAGGVPRFARFIRVREGYEWKGKMKKEDILKPKKPTVRKAPRVQKDGELSFCFTGPMYDMSRAQIKSFTEEHGGIVRSSVSKKLSYLVTNTPQSSTTKNKKAKDLGIKIISEKEFIELMKNE